MSKFIRYTVTLAFAMISFMSFASDKDARPASEFDLGLQGRVNMEGSIFSSACNIDLNTGDGYQTVAMGTDSRRRIERTGQGDPQGFTIYLTNCSMEAKESSAAWQYLQITFEGNDHLGMFGLEGNASGVALEVTDKNGDSVIPGKAMSYRPSSSDINRFDYQIRLKTTMRNLMAGDYHAILRYRVEYF